MKKQYFHRRSQGFRSGGFPVWLTGGTVCFAVLLVLFRSLFPGIFFSVATPFWETGSAVSSRVGSFFIEIGNNAKLVQENKTLLQEISTLQNENAVLTARSQDLTSLLGGQQQTSSNILAGVLAGPPLSPYDTLIVNAGSARGVLVGANVFAAGGIPIGTVKEVTHTSAVIQLLSTPGVTTNAWAGAARVPITMLGMGAGAYTATLPTAASVSLGDTIYAPGPGAVPFGTIIKIDSDSSSPTVILHVQSLVNLFSTTWVEISPTVGTL